MPILTNFKRANADTSSSNRAAVLRGTVLRQFHANNPSLQVTMGGTSSGDLTEIQQSQIPPVILPPVILPLVAQPIPLPYIPGGIDLTKYLIGLPQPLYPSINVFGSISYPYSTVFTIQHFSHYPIPSGFTFLCDWHWQNYDPALVTISSTSGSLKDIATGSVTHSANNLVSGNIPILPGSYCMFSLQHTKYCRVPDYDGIGVCMASSPTSSYVGYDRTSFGFYDDGQEWVNNDSLNPNPDLRTAFFETDGDILDVAVDAVRYVVWYRVNGGVWQGITV